MIHGCGVVVNVLDCSREFAEHENLHVLTDYQLAGEDGTGTGVAIGMSNTTKPEYFLQFLQFENLSKEQLR